MTEINPNNAHLKAMREHWQKIVGILLNKFAPGCEVIIEVKDVEALTKISPGEIPVVVSWEQRDGIHLKLVGEREARKLAARHGREEN